MTTEAITSALDSTQIARIQALRIVRDLYPDLDVFDLVRLADYILTGDDGLHDDLDESRQEAP